MNIKKIIRPVLAVLIAALVLFYLGYQVYLVNYKPVKTETALKYTIGKTADTTIFVIREENYLTNSASGTMIPIIEDGSRVAKGNNVEVVFNSDDDAAKYSKLKNLESSINYFESLKSQISTSYVMDVDAINDGIVEKLENYLENISSENYSKITESGEAFRDKATRLQIATGTYSFDIDGKLNELKNEYNNLKSSMPKYTGVTTDKAGYYVSNVDGYEKSYNYKNVESITCDDIDTLISSKPSDIDKNVVGKIVSNFRWYIVCNVSSDDVSEFKVGRTVTVKPQGSSADDIETTVAKINARGDGRAALVLSCSMMNKDLANLRKCEAKIVLEEFTGYKVKPQAIRMVDNQTGVYVLRGYVVTFRKVDIIYSEQNFVLVNSVDGKDGYIKMYDEVIIEGSELYDGKVI